MKLAIIVGSIREGRHTHKIAYYLHQLLENTPDIEPHLLDLAKFDLPLLRDRWEKQNPQPDILRAFSDHLREADAMLFVSPEYHGSYSGVFKNAVDHYWKEFERKPIGVICTGSGPMGGINASTQLQLLILAVGAYPSPKKLLIPHVNKAFDEDNYPLSDKLQKQTRIFLDEFLWFARALSQANKRIGHSTS